MVVTTSLDSFLRGCRDKRNVSLLVVLVPADTPKDSFRRMLYIVDIGRHVGIRIPMSTEYEKCRYDQNDHCDEHITKSLILFSIS